MLPETSIFLQISFVYYLKSRVKERGQKMEIVNLSFSDSFSNWNPELRASFGSLRWRAGAQALVPSSAIFPGTIAGRWMGNGTEWHGG